MESKTLVIQRTQYILLSSLLLCFLVSGCVSSRKYNDLESQYATMELQLAQAEEENERADPLLRRSPRRGEDISGQVHRPDHGAEVRPPFSGRSA